MRARALLLLILLAGTARAEEPVTVAVASNFQSTAMHLASRFQDRTGHFVRLSNGSTGKLYAQIVHGAPFDVFLAADAERPTLLEDSGVAVYGSRFTYAEGGLVVFSRSQDDCLAALKSPDAGRVALANPATSPYGAASRQYLESAGLWDQVSLRAVYGENIMQAWQFGYTNNAVVGLAARVHLRAFPGQTTCSFEVSPEFHDPIEQQAVLLDAGNDAARQFLEFLQTPEARTIIRQDGYEVPD